MTPLRPPLALARSCAGLRGAQRLASGREWAEAQASQLQLRPSAEKLQDDGLGLAWLLHVFISQGGTLQRGWCDDA